MLDGKTVLVTGGTGSFGTKFVEVALTRHSPKRVIVFSRDELKQHDMRREFGDPRLSFFIGDVRDRARLERAFEADVDVVVHAAAMKQVPACEYNPFEAIKTNVLGAQNVIDAAIDRKVPNVIALSTDKAVNPVNLYGATKLCAEKLFVQGNAYAGGRGTRFACVRYGNVVGSRGSVVPLFLEQKRFGQVTLTDERMTRFWLTLEQGVEFVIASLSRMRGGEVFVPRIPSMSMVDLARTLAPGCKIKVTGIRPGEKLHECLLSSDEARHAVELDDAYVILPEHAFWNTGIQGDGAPIADEFEFSSHTNDRWLTGDELLGLVKAA
ncbi:MAG TPA: UDP-N-acetylglucosamine 4,6-dehydratase (inverting) [Gaiellaceae bacterium]|nr:UDP-N-acetylglucosamine 4,6-dehydratase (inverting) [Gaiellaceae bacterium]